MIQGFLLAGGDSSRMGQPKALLRVDGEEAWWQLAHKMLQAGCSRVAIAIPTALHPAMSKRLAAHPSLRLVVIPEAQRERGAIGSLSHLISCVDAGYRCCLVAPVDHPYVSKDTLRVLLGGSGPIRIPTYEGRRGHPIVLEAEIALRVLSLEGTLRTLCRDPAIGTVEYPVEDASVLWNLDTPEDYERYQAKST